MVQNDPVVITIRSDRVNDLLEAGHSGGFCGSNRSQGFLVDSV
jgi:hypothetical protein